MYFILQWHLWCGSRKWTCYTELWKRTRVHARSVYCRVKNEESRLFCRIRQGFFFLGEDTFPCSKNSITPFFPRALGGPFSSCMFNITNSNSKHGAVFPDRWIYEKASVPSTARWRHCDLNSLQRAVRKNTEKFHSDVVSTQINRISGISICSRTPSNTFAFWNEFT